MSEDRNIRKVIFADDDEDDYQIFVVAVEELELNIHLRQAKNGEMLLQLMEADAPDLLFLDIYMPCKDGRQCIREIRANSNYDSIPIIIYTGMTDTEHI